VLKNSFQGILTAKFVRKLLIARSPQARKFAEITALVPFSTPTPHFVSNSASASYFGIAYEIAWLRQLCCRAHHTCAGFWDDGGTQGTCSTRLSDIDD
jgi:hypothetical protein